MNMDTRKLRAAEKKRCNSHNCAQAMHPDIEVWETCTPYFDRRNIHFYINRCGFHAVEFFNEHHPDPHMPDQFDQEDGLFKFEKRMIRKKT